MFEIFVKVYLNAIAFFSQISMSHQLVYCILAGLYAGAGLGLEKGVVNGLLAISYAALALDSH